MLINGLLEEPQQALRIDRCRNNPGVERCRPTFGVDLAEVEQEFEGIVSDFEIVGVSPIRLPAILHVLAFTAHHNLPMQRVFLVLQSAARFRSVISASAVPTSPNERSLCSKYWSVKAFLSGKAFAAFQPAGKECKQRMLHFIGRCRGDKKIEKQGRICKSLRLSRKA